MQYLPSYDQLSATFLYKQSARIRRIFLSRMLIPDPKYVVSMDSPWNGAHVSRFTFFKNNTFFSNARTLKFLTRPIVATRRDARHARIFPEVPKPPAFQRYIVRLRSIPRTAQI